MLAGRCRASWRDRHADWTGSGANRGGHTAPGPNFPWDVFMAIVNQGENDMTPDESAALYDIRAQLCGRSARYLPGWFPPVVEWTPLSTIPPTGTCEICRLDQWSETFVRLQWHHPDHDDDRSCDAAAEG